MSKQLLVFHHSKYHPYLLGTYTCGCRCCVQIKDAPEQEPAQQEQKSPEQLLQANRDLELELKKAK